MSLRSLAIVLALSTAPLHAAPSGGSFTRFKAALVTAALDFSPSVTSMLRDLDSLGYLRAAHRQLQEQAPPPPSLSAQELTDLAFEWARREHLNIERGKATGLPQYTEMRVVDARPVPNERGWPLDCLVKMTFKFSGYGVRTYYEDHFFWLRIQPSTGLVPLHEGTGKMRTPHPSWATTQPQG
jgi:hypothetical protein